jgi:mannose-6-phosphate isomerase-like protein (cupin superfamily)
MHTSIHPFDSSAEFNTPERCLITEVLNDDSSPELSIARARVEPGITTAWHKLTGTDERYLIISGTGRMEMEGIEPANVFAGDIVCIPPETPQRITNTGSDDLLFFCACTPRFRPENYISLE